jgi:hypothetical protein
VISCAGILTGGISGSAGSNALLSPLYAGVVRDCLRVLGGVGGEVV